MSTRGAAARVEIGGVDTVGAMNRAPKWEAVGGPGELLML